MPVTWSISHEEQLVVAIAEGEVVRGDIDGYLSAMIAEGAMPYRKLFDLTFAPMALAAADLRALGKRVTDYAKADPSGPRRRIARPPDRHDAAAGRRRFAQPAERHLRGR